MTLSGTIDAERLKLDALPVVALQSNDPNSKSEMELHEAKIRTAETEHVGSLPALLKEREAILQRAFLAAKNKYEAGLIGIDQFSEVVYFRYAANGTIPFFWLSKNQVFEMSSEMGLVFDKSQFSKLIQRQFHS